MFGTNWTATYYNSRDLSGPVVYTEVLPNGINVNWGVGSPSPTVLTDNFSARFTSVQLFDAAIYEFVISSDAGVRVFIDDVLVLDRFVVRSLTTNRFQLPMTEGIHSLKIEYFAAVGQAAIQALWYATARFIETPKSTEQPTLEELGTQLHEALEPVQFLQYGISSLREMLDHSIDNPFFHTNASYYYRGQENSKWGLTPTVFRKISGEVSVNNQEDYLQRVCQLERAIYDEFTNQSRAYLPAWVDRDSPWELMCVAQHFGVPTRLLDWTGNLEVTQLREADTWDEPSRDEWRRE